MDKPQPVRYLPSGITNHELQELFEQDPHYFLEQLNQSLLNGSGDFGGNLKPDNYRHLQRVVLDRLRSDSDFTSRYLLQCLSFLCLLSEKIPEEYGDFIMKHLDHPDSRIRGAIFRLIRDAKLSMEKARFMTMVQDEIAAILAGGDDTCLQYALEAIAIYEGNDFRLLLNGAMGQFTTKLDELARQATMKNWPQRTYLANAIRTLRRFTK